MTLNQRWKELKDNASTENVLMTVSQISQYYSRGRININPAYQRDYRWRNDQKTKFIESLLLKYPIPPIITIKTEGDNGLPNFEIIDGVQRLSTIFEFMDVKSKSGERVKNQKAKLKKLEGANIFTEINDKDFKDFQAEDFDFILESSTLLFTNFTTKNEETKYEMFERLNTLSSQLSPQEIRNSLIAMKNKEAFLILSKEIREISRSFLNKKAFSTKLDLEYFTEFSLIKRYDEYKEIIEDQIQKRQENRKNSKHLDILLTAYSRTVKIDEILSDISDYREFIEMNKNLNFKKYKPDKNKTSGQIVKFFFELLSNLYYKNKEEIDEEFYRINFSKNYADIMKEDLDLNNPNAKVRFLKAKEVIENYDGSGKLF